MVQLVRVVQVVRHEGKRRIVVRHIGSARDQIQLEALVVQAEQYAKAHRTQPSLFTHSTAGSLDLAHTTLVGGTHLFA